MKSSQAVIPDLHDLVRLFYQSSAELAEFQPVEGPQMPDVYDRLLNHNHHMTVTVESHHGSDVAVRVLEYETRGDVYLRKILLETPARVVMFGIVRLHTRYLADQVRREIESRQIPLGRVLIQHNVLRRVELGKLWRVQPGPELQRHFQSDRAQVTFGRTAVIHCNHEPAIELVEIVAPEIVSPDSPCDDAGAAS